MSTVTFNTLRKLTPAQKRVYDSKASRIMIRSGRQTGKTTGVENIATRRFIEQGSKVLYVAPSSSQKDSFERGVAEQLAPLLEYGILRHDSQKGTFYYRDNDTLEAPRITARTADTPARLRGINADLIILDEYQVLDDYAYRYAIAPMLITRKNAQVVFAFTPPTIRSSKGTKASDKMHAEKHWEVAKASNLYETHEWTFADNPYANLDELTNLKQELREAGDNLVWQIEYLGMEVVEQPGALWTRAMIAYETPPPIRELTTVIGVDPSAGGRDETGIVVIGYHRDTDTTYVLEDLSVSGQRPEQWAHRVVESSRRYNALVSLEMNGFEGIESTLKLLDPEIDVEPLRRFGRDKYGYAVPVSVMYSSGKVYHAERFILLEQQMTGWTPDDKTYSPDRIDALVNATIALGLDHRESVFV